MAISEKEYYESMRTASTNVSNGKHDGLKASIPLTEKEIKHHNALRKASSNLNARKYGQPKSLIVSK